MHKVVCCPFPPGTEVEIVEFEGNTGVVGKCGVVDHLSGSWIIVDLSGDNYFVNLRKSQLRVRCKMCSEGFHSKFELDNHLTTCMAGITNQKDCKILKDPASMPILTDCVEVGLPYPKLNHFDITAISIHVDKATEAQYTSSLPTVEFMNEVNSREQEGDGITTSSSIDILVREF